MDKRERIIQSAIDAFLTKGIQKTTISDIVQGAEIAQGTFYLYFPSKMSLMPAIAEVMVEKTLEIVEEKVNRHHSFEQQMKQMIASIFNVNATYHEIQALIYAGLASSEHIKNWEAVYEPIYAYLREWLKTAINQEEIRQDVQVEQVSKLLIGLIESAAEQIYLYDEPNEQAAQIQKEAVFEFIQHALQMKVEE